MDRRGFLRNSLGLAAGAALGWEVVDRLRGEPTAVDGPVHHLLIGANNHRLRAKLSLVDPPAAAPVLRIEGVATPGTRNDSDGRFWLFDVNDLDPGTTHRLRLETHDGEQLLDDWDFRTFPSPDARPDRFRMLAYTCAGGHGVTPSRRLGQAFLPMHLRRRLLARGLAFDPDVVVANGDHVYWDLGRWGWALGNSPAARWRAGLFDPALPVMGSRNEGVLTRAFGPQIADLYGTALRGVPVVFVKDDHDYTEDDLWLGDHGTFPVDDFMLDVGVSTRRLYYPEFLPAPGMPDQLFGPGDVGYFHGAIRWGQLFEGLVYDGRVELDKSRDGGFVSPATEAWIRERLEHSPADHVAQLPSTPFGWTAGKWLEWYPDTPGRTEPLTIEEEKPGWSPGWQAQHNRLLAAAASRPDRIPMVFSGDLHATAAGWIHRSGGLDLTDNPALTVLTGTLGTGTEGWPSRVRGVGAMPSATLDLDELVAPIEQNGFALVDFTPTEVEVQLFVWDRADGPEAIDDLEPAYRLTARRPL